MAKPSAKSPGPVASHPRATKQSAQHASVASRVKLKAKPGRRPKTAPQNSEEVTAFLSANTDLSPRQETFCQLVATGLYTHSEAYEKAGYTPDGSHATRLAQNGRIRARIFKLKMEQSKANKMSQQEILTFLADIIQTPATEVNEGSPLIQEVSETRTGRRIVKIPSKMEAMKLMASICGWEKGTQADQDAAKALGGVAELMQRIRARK
jgi:hypothetical protein